EEADDSENAELEESTGFTLLRDPSGTVLPADRWYQEEAFWGRIARAAGAGIKAANADVFALSDGEEINAALTPDPTFRVMIRAFRSNFRLPCPEVFPS